MIMGCWGDGGETEDDRERTTVDEWEVGVKREDDIEMMNMYETEVGVTQNTTKKG